MLQRWNGALKIYPHWHILAADGTWQQTTEGRRFVQAAPLTEAQLSDLLQDAVARILRQVKKLQKARGDGDDDQFAGARSDSTAGSANYSPLAG